MFMRSLKLLIENLELKILIKLLECLEKFYDFYKNLGIFVESLGFL